MSNRTTIPEDLYKFELPSSPTLSPDRQHAIYEKTISSLENNNYETQLYLTDIKGNSRRILENLGTSNVEPIWSPDGKTVAFVSDAVYGRQVWLFNFEDDETYCLTRFRHGISSIIWSPNGKTIYGVVPVDAENEVEVFTENQSVEDANNEIMQCHMDWDVSAKRFNRLYYKNDGIGLQTSLIRQIVAIDVRTGAIEQLTRGTNDVFEPTVSADGRYIAFNSNRENEIKQFCGQIYRVATSGGEVELLYDNYQSSSASYSPDGKWLAFFATESCQKQLLVIPSNGGDARCLSEQYPDTLCDMNFTDMRYLKSPLRPQWSKNSQSVYALGTREGRNEIIRFSMDPVQNQGVVIIGGDRTIFHYAHDGDKTFVVAYSTVNHPGKIAVIKVDESDTIEFHHRDPKEEFSITSIPLFPEVEVRLDDCNDQLLTELIVVEPETFSYQSEDDWQIQGFVLKPANMEEGRKYPVLLDIHGGPHSSYGFSYFHQMQLFAAHGYAVIYINPRGSSGFGKEFTNAVHGDYGGKDMTDILNGLDEALRQFDYLDGNQVAVNGISYGGFMVNWLVTHTNRFFAAVSEGCISNWVSMYGTSDISPLFVEQEFQGKTDFETLLKFSPLSYVDQVKTPLMLLHCENDLRCPIEQAEQFYSHIKRRGGEVEFVRMPNASHGLLAYGEPRLRVERLNAMINFINTRLLEPIKAGAFTNERGG
ncbi:S9 family peptidase [Viridibacillus arvi]|uniref:S9 family peptidase n=1 Tax=Viridibacillus arvi TaxID=263475 RepID=UPI003681DF4F